MREGFGIQYDKFNRKMFEGEFKENVLNGDGIVFYKQNFSGDKVFYEGQFLNGLYHGQGVIFEIDGILRYKGEFLEGEKSG